MEERILTKHPEKGKRGVSISQAKYEAVRSALVSALRARGEMTFEELAQAVERKLDGKFEGAIRWYYTTVKLDLEARKLLRRVPGSRPQRVRLNQE